MSTPSATPQSRTAILTATLRRLIRRPWSAWPLLKRADLRMAADLARGLSYTEANRRRMDRRVSRDPDDAIGGTDTGIGELQYQTLVAEGLSPSDRLLDVGCGTLRGGQYIIDYLEAGNYVGLDISAEALDAGRERLGEATLQEKQPRLVQNDDLRFDEVSEPVDYALAQSVWTHIPPEAIEECLAHIGDVLTPDGALYATHYQPTTDEAVQINGPSSFRYSEAYLRSTASAYGWQCDRLEYDHPTGQRLLRFTRD